MLVNLSADAEKIKGIAELPLVLFVAQRGEGWSSLEGGHRSMRWQT
jgi:hypothetical protein